MGELAGTSATSRAGFSALSGRLPDWQRRLWFTSIKRLAEKKIILFFELTAKIGPDFPRLGIRFWHMVA